MCEPMAWRLTCCPGHGLLGGKGLESVKNRTDSGKGQSNTVKTLFYCMNKCNRRHTKPTLSDERFPSSRREELARIRRRRRRRRRRKTARRIWTVRLTYSFMVVLVKSLCGLLPLKVEHPWVPCRWREALNKQTQRDSMSFIRRMMYSPYIKVKRGKTSEKGMYWRIWLKAPSAIVLLSFWLRHLRILLIEEVTFPKEITAFVVDEVHRQGHLGMLSGVCVSVSSIGQGFRGIHLKK